MSQYDVQAVEKEIANFWKKNNIKTKVIQHNKTGKPFFLLDGPPYANNIPHIGHVRTTVYKDLYIRNAFLHGKNVLFNPGFDTHGLPIENMVEKKLGLKNKQDIHTFGIKNFIQECKKSAVAYKDEWLKIYQQIGSHYEGEEPYLTFNNSYIESAWWAFKQIWDKGLVYEGQKPVFWCPHCQTSLAGYEVTDSYKEVTDPGVYVKFKLADEDAYILVFTTTPWTLPANVALAIHPKKDYVKVNTNKGKLILAKKRLKFLDEIKLKYKILEEFKGKKIVGKKYIPLLKLPQQTELEKNPNAHKVIASINILKERIASKIGAKKGIQSKDVYEDFVTDEDGTGLVHTAPGHGKTDNEVGIHYKLPAVSPLDEACRFTDLAGKYAGEFVKDADHIIAEDLNQQGKLLHFQKITHKYPLCWRCKSPLIFKLANQWFIDIQPQKQKMLEQNEDVEWQPEFAKERMRNWLANVEDWNFSRQRFWGIPIPIWKSEDGEYLVVGSEKEFNLLTQTRKGFDLHEAIEKPIQKNGKTYHKVKDIFDVWYDSGCAPFASLNYPFKNKELFDKQYPVDRISESQDQVRGWFYYLMATNTLLFGKVPYKIVSMPGWVLDAKGDKMSKSEGNFISASEGLNTLGADALRFYYCWDNAPYNTAKFNMDIAKNEIYKVLNILWNLHSYVLKEEFSIYSVPKTVEDQWILSRLNTVLKEYEDGIQKFELHNAGRTIYDFIIEDLSRKYVQLIRDRTLDDQTPFSIIYQCVKKIIIVLSPIAPFISEKIYQEFKVKERLKESVQLEQFPAIDSNNKKLEQDFEQVFEIITAVLAARDSANIGLRWPLAEVQIQAKNKKHEDIIKNQTNIKKIVWKPINLDYQLKPNYRNIGKKLGPDTAEFIAKIPKIQHLIKKGQEYEFKGQKISLQDFEKQTEVPENKKYSETKNVKILLSLKQDAKLIKEGISREIIRRIQLLRKQAGLTKQEKIILQISGDIKDYAEEIKKITNAEKIEWTDSIKTKHKSELNINNNKYAIGLNIKSQ